MTGPASSCDTSRVLKVLLAAPLPPPHGGIAKWTTLMLGVTLPADIARHHFDCAVHTQYHFTSKLTLRRILGQLGLILRFGYTLLRLRPDVLHLTTSYDLGWVRDNMFLRWAQFLGVATILNIRGGDFERFYRGLSSRRQKRALETLARCTALIPITEETAEFLRSLGLPRVRIIPNCIELDSISPRRTAVPVLGSRWRWLFVGWVTPSKGIEELLDALRAIPDAELTIIGPVVEGLNTDMAAMIRRALSDPLLRGRVIHVPGLPISEIANAYPAHDLFVFPTHREGFPNVLLEAMSAAIPIVSTRVGAIPEMARDDQEALLVAPRDSSALIHAIQRLQGDALLADRLSRAARRRVEACYGLEPISATWFGMYRSAAFENAARRT
jgi:glycosyltransferase involved in cell wall biosynthesis